MTTANKGANMTTTTAPTLYIDKQQAIFCGYHAPRVGAKQFHPEKYHPADVAALARASGGTIGCETCRAIAARKVA